MPGTETQPVIPSPDQARQEIFNNVYSSVFFQKLASHGFAPRTQDEASELLELSAKLATVAPAVKAASAPSAFNEASTALDSYLQSQGLDGRLKQAGLINRDNAAVKVARQLMADPAIFNAALVLKAAAASEIAAKIKTN